MAKDWDAAHRPTPIVPRPELAALAGVQDSDARLFLRFYLRSNIERDLDIARTRCAQYSIDYEVARKEARQS